ncbi:5,6-dimethylbenzimidazole synthase [Pseudonocardia sp. KRD-184]|uniref:5,6-dimethylbenzimidazole synthase n=1 Tax=Pseudonocardia oceani TaxID=2792013 RepID=A0ABS6U3P5_9PSEU|nr:5,6-dimethylbenzimidazole synthase [Pseudonocardia oceani]MBW0092009.1 5,6-dimethylbenzimidazole synthase [Pseudonocardia oceani]MBW0099608.1 5,6-dimethylbenzimidazole synthase [Pseudonocardia oceani]MBW0112333.1 5,6-dimethylbenzimidazole synthase [Pseudonocardia oceani]MBW0123959.1 5,6-dimethylbenzimidazole synthase [Pseudonocardia oceani]MBW0126784.1 5,6-dimethylbenzimidazole synthase [Pseudonocardia oceani]
MSRDLYDVIARRRDVRTEFVDAPLEEDVLWRVLDAAHRAPSVGLTQPWDFVVVRDRTVRARFAAHVEEQRREFAAGLDAERAATFGPITVQGILGAAAGIVVTCDPDRGGPHVLGAATVPDTVLFSTLLAVQNLWLAATAEGLGVGWVSFYREPFLRELVGAPEGVRPVAWLCVGPVSHLEEVPDLERHRWRARRPLGEAVHRERFGAGPV